MLHRYKSFYEFVLAASVFVLTPFNAAAFDLPLPKGAERWLQLPPGLEERFTDKYNFEGIVALDNCSGSIVRFESSKDTDFAMVLTNGHCYEEGMPSAGQVYANQGSSRVFRVLDPTAQSLGLVTASKMIISTMTKTDITLYQLKQTYAQILSRFGVRPLTIWSQHPTLGTGLEIISGYWSRGYTCAIEAFVHELDEAGWAMFDSIRYTRPGCETIGGTSGSPIVAAGSRTVIGINNTGNEDGERCTMNNPCEVDDNGNVTATQGFSYGQQTYLIYSCLNSAQQVDLAVPGCQLAPTQVH